MTSGRMGKDLVDLTFYRENAEEPWGFRLAGGKDYGQPLSISQVAEHSLAAKIGLKQNDFLNSIAAKNVFELTHDQAEKLIMSAGNRFNMVIERVNFKKYEKKAADISASKTLEEKPHMRKDWNCPWVRKDGSGLKQAVRYIDEPSAPAKTSQHHYYSEPRSILAPDKELSREELEALIREHGGESRPDSRMSQGSRPASSAARTQGGDVREQQQQQEYREEYQQEYREVRQEHQEHRVNFAVEERETYCGREREEESQAPPDLEPVVNAMPQFQHEAGYEPSADELIDVLKNLENLAADNPQLYRSIVDQIKGTGHAYQEVQQNGQQQYEQEMYEQELYQQQQQQEAQLYQQQCEEQAREMERVQALQQQMYEEASMRSQQQTTEYSSMQETSMSEESAYLQQQQLIQQQQAAEEQLARKSMSEEEFKQHQKMKRLEAEAQEEVRQTLARQREAKIKAMKAAEPQKPKEITVIAGDGKKVLVQLGGEQHEDSRKQVAEAAGLKHVPLPDFGDEDDAAWAGSLNKTSRTKRPDEPLDDENPWAGSLRHVKEKPGRKHKGGDQRDDTYGSAPWMGTLRHVVHDNKVTRNYGVNQHQSKRYPDEDAGNPFESMQGQNAKPAFPLTPAAIINGSAMTRDEMARREEEEEVAKIRQNIGSKTVSTALLQVLMPKLLKMHETKYSPMEKADAEQIMEEILGMQCGLNPNQQADANEEAEMIIRAIMQDEVDNSIYSKMADDLEAASKRMKKRKVTQVKENAQQIAA